MTEYDDLGDIEDETSEPEHSYANYNKFEPSLRLFQIKQESTGMTISDYNEIVKALSDFIPQDRHCLVSYKKITKHVARMTNIEPDVYDACPNSC
jgi:hypothetical protein